MTDKDCKSHSVSIDNLEGARDKEYKVDVRYFTWKTIFVNLIIVTVFVTIIIVAMTYPSAQDTNIVEDGVKKIDPDTLLSYFNAGNRWTV